MRFTLLFVCMVSALGARAIHADFIMSVTSGCSPLTVQFTDKSTGGATKWEWDFDKNPNRPREQNPKGIFNEDGEYRIKLTAYDASGNASSITKTLTVHKAPEADFSADQTGGCTPLMVRFTDLSKKGSSEIVSWLWYFGDGERYEGKSPPAHEYKTVGKHKVSLQVTDKNGCSHTFTRDNFITTSPGPVVDFKVSDSTKCEPPFTVNFTAKVKNLSGNQLTYLWTFGDDAGGTSTEINPIYTYKKSGVFTVSLMVRDVNGCITIKGKQDFIQLFTPKAEFFPDYVPGCPIRKVTFINTTTPVAPGMKWHWELEPGVTSDTIYPRHTYKKPGEYNVKLTVTNLEGCTSTTVRKVTIFSGKPGERPVADFNANPTSGCSRDMKVYFQNLTDGADSFFWHFGDGSPITSGNYNRNPVHVYDFPGEYTVTLHASKNRCTDTAVKQKVIKVLPPMARFRVGNKCGEEFIQILDESIGATSYFYDFGDGNTSKEKSPSHRYSKIGRYCITQRVYNETTGCEDTSRVCIDLKPLIVNMYVGPESGCIPLKVLFGASSSHSAIYKWNFGDGLDTVMSSSEDPPLEHIYTARGKFRITLKVLDYRGCEKTLVKEFIHVYGPEVAFTVSPQEGCSPMTVTLTDSVYSDTKIIKKEYDMGDGTKLLVTDKVMTYTYSSPPDTQAAGYLIGLYVTDEKGCVGYAERNVFPGKPKPQIKIIPKPVCGYMRYWFEPLVNGIPPYTYKWSSDGTTGTNEIFQKYFEKSGTYQVHLTVTDKNGCSDTTSISLPVEVKALKARFSVSATEVACPPLLVDFTNESTPGNAKIVKWEWDFGDGSPLAPGRDAKYLYNAPGRYTARLIITDSVGCKDTFTYPTSFVVNGPVVSYKISKTNGCVPVTVTFSAESKDATGVIWDRGDGIDTNWSFTHTYTKPGIYYPALLVKRETSTDTCIYSLPRRDTIVVSPMPGLKFSFSGDCFGYPTIFSSDASTDIGTIKNLTWDFGDLSFSSDRNPAHIYEKPGLYPVKLFISNKEGCEASLTKTIKIGGLDAKFSTGVHGACIGEPVEFTDETFADTAILSREWDFGDSTTATIPNPVHTYAKKGVYRVTFRVTDYRGCTDVMTIPEFAVGDNTPPPAPRMHRVTVEPDNSVRLEFSKHKDIDLAYYIISRGGANGFHVIDSVKGTNDTVYFDKKADAANASYCYKVKALTFCNFLSPEDKEHCSINLKGTPAVNSSVLAWNAYTGWEVGNYGIYREDVYNPGSFVKLGTVDAGTFSFTDSAIICYRTHHYRVRAQEKGGLKRVSWSNTVQVTPNYIPDVPSNEVIRATVENNRDILVEWTEAADTKVKHYILERSEDGIKYRAFDNLFSPSETDSRDEKVKVSEKSYYYRTRIIDSCGDAGPYSNLGRTILLRADTTPDLYPSLIWNRYSGWSEDVRYYDLELKDAKGTFCKIARVNSTDTSYVDKFTDFNSLDDYCYRVIAYRGGTPSNPDANIHITSISNEACVPARSVIWIPNAFTPNGDRLNDEFLVNAMYISKFHMQIFDRWGTRVFITDKLTKGWDGKYKNGAPLLDVYRYMIIAQGVDGVHHYRNGWVTVLR